MLEFGKKKDGLEYKDRPGAYALILRKDGMIGAVEGKLGGLHLPGGGIDEGEIPEEGLRREVMEEMVREVKSAKFVGEAIQYVVHPELGALRKICKFFLVELVDGPDGHGDRVTHWATPEEFEQKLFFESHSWAVKEFLLK